MYPKKTVHKVTSYARAIDEHHLEYELVSRCGKKDFDKILDKTSTKWGRVTCKECIATKAKPYNQGV